jgi:hypothetical protein
MPAVFARLIDAAPLRRALLVTVAAWPLLQGQAARADTTLSTAVTTPVATSTVAGGASDNLYIDGAGSITLSTAGPALTLDSNNNVALGGAITINNLEDSTGILVLGGRSGTVQSVGAISIVEDHTPADADADGEADGPFAIGARRYGIRVTGAQPFTGDIITRPGGQITVEGVDSAGIAVDARLSGHLVQAGGVSVVGARSVGVRTADVAGDVRITGSVAAVGEGAAAVSTGEIGGVLQLQNAIAATGYRSTARLADADRAKLDADDLLQGGPAVRVGGNVWGGVILDRAPADLSTTVTDEDGDGIEDAAEQMGVLISSGAAPALDIGSASNITLGRVGAGEDAFGLVLKGQVFGNGINDGVSATGIRIGQPGGGATLLQGGLNLRGGVISAEAFGADATAVRLNAGADVREIRNSAGGIFAKSTTEGANTIAGVLIESGAVAGALLNAGSIRADVVGGAGSAFAIADHSGTLSFINNTGVIEATVVPAAGKSLAGQVVAIDLRAATGPTLIRQVGASDGDDGADGVADADADADGVDDADEPRIFGDVLLGSGADRIEILNGTLTGNLAFGLGADSLLIDGGGQVQGTVSDADGRLALEVRSGSLSLLQTGVVPVTSLTVGAKGALTLLIDPQGGAASRIEASGLAAFDAGAKVGIKLQSLLTAPQSFELVRAGALRFDGANIALTGAPFLYNATLRVDVTGGRLYADLRRRTASELGLGRSGAQAYDAVFGAMGVNDAVETAFLSKVDQVGFSALYDQMLPGHSGAPLRSVDAISRALSSATALARPNGADPGSSTFWAQEIYFNLNQDRVDALGYRAKAFGLAAGLEQTTYSNGAYGLALGLVSTEYADRGAGLGERTVMNFAGGSVYARKEMGGWLADVRAGGGLLTFDSDRRIVSAADKLDLTAKADWLGWMAEAHAGLAYVLRLGRLYLRPRTSIDYVRVHQQGYEEEGGAAGVDLDIDSGGSSRLSGTGTLSLGMEFGDSFRWGPELTFGRREVFSGKAGATVGRFVGGGADFSLSPEAVDKSATVMRAGFKGSALGPLVTVDGGLETAGPYRQWDIRAVAKFAF